MIKKRTFRATFVVIACVGLLSSVGCSRSGGEAKSDATKPAQGTTTATEKLAAASDAAERPGKWARAVEVEGAPNLYQVSDTLYRSAQPTALGMKNLKKNLGIKTVVNLRSFHSDRDELGET